MYTTSIMINAPETFVPVPVEEKAAPKPQPPAVPPKPFKDTRVFQNVDTHAVEVICCVNICKRNLIAFDTNKQHISFCLIQGLDFC